MREAWSFPGRFKWRAFNGMKSEASLGNEAPGFSTASGNNGSPCAHDANASSPNTLGTLTAHHLAKSLKTWSKKLRQKSELQWFQLNIFEQYGVVPLFWVLLMWLMWSETIFPKTSTDMRLLKVWELLLFSRERLMYQNHPKPFKQFKINVKREPSIRLCRSVCKVPDRKETGTQ